MKLNGSQIIAEVLIENGVDTVFGYPGGAVLNIYDALYEYSDRITHYMTAHEQGASHAADGYARATGKTGVVIATSGPGATNLVTGIATAYMDSIPMVAITGNVAQSLIGRDSFQEVYIAGITMPITKHNFVVRDVEKLADTLREAFKIASSGRPGPVLVDIPKDITAAVCEYTKAEPAKIEHTPQTYDLTEIASVINNAKRPVIYFGGGVRLSHAGEELQSLIAKADIPATHTIMGAGVLRWDDERNLGIIGMHGTVCANRAVDRSDCVIALGTRFSDRVALDPDNFAPVSKIIQIDVDRGEIKKNVDVDYSIVGDVKDVLKALLPLIEEKTHDEWNAQLKQWQLTAPHPKDSDEVLRPHQIMDIISEEAGEDAIYVTDVGQHQMWAAQYLHHTDADKFLTSGGLGTMGYGYGAAIGAEVGARPHHTVHITGDGSFHMNMNEACTAVTYGLPIITVILNNSALGMVRQWQTVFYGKRYSSSEPERVTNYAKVAEGFGLKGFRCTNPAEFRDAMKAALKENGPVWIECIVDREERVLPMIPAGKSVEAMIIE